MRLLSLRLKNFRQYEETSIEFRPGITAIVGPNGSGKTTLLEAIAWALYGSPAIRGSNETLRRAGAPARSAVEVALEFALDAHRYRIVRRTDRAELFVDGSPHPAHAGVQPVSDAVRRMFGMDYRAFFTSYFTGQKDLAFLSGMGKQERASSVGRMLGYDRLTRARDRANQDRLALDREIEGLQRGMGDAAEIESAARAAEAALAATRKEGAQAQLRLDRASKALESLRPKFELSSERQARYQDLIRQTDRIERDLAHLQAQIESHRTEIARLDALQRDLTALQPDREAYRLAEKEFEEMRPLRAFDRQRRGILGQVEGIQKRIEELKPRAEGLEAATLRGQSLRVESQSAADSLQQASEKLNRLTSEWSGRRREIAAGRAGLEKQKKTLAERRQGVVALGADGICPTCARPLAGDISSVVTHFDEEIAGIDADLVKIDEDLRALGDKPAEAAALEAESAALKTSIPDLQRRESEVAGQIKAIELARRDLNAATREAGVLQAQLADLPEGFDNARYDELADTGKRLKPVDRRAAEIENELKRRPDWANRLKEAEDAWVVRSEELDAVVKAVKTMKFSPEAHERISGDFAAAEAEERQSERAAAETKTALARAEGAASAAKERAEEYERKAVDLKERQSRRLCLRTLTESLENLRVELNALARPELEDLAGRLLDELTDGRYPMMELTDQYEPFLLEDDERKPVISGGEEDVTHLCLRLAISQMIAGRSGQPLSLLVLDEIFGSLDATRRENVVALLQRLKRSFDQIILITHIETIHDTVDQCLWVRYDPGSRTSRISESREDGDGEEGGGAGEFTWDEEDSAAA